MNTLLLLSAFFLLTLPSKGDVKIRQAWYLNQQQQKTFGKVMALPEYQAVRKELLSEWEQVITRKPSPLAKINYEGQLDTDPRRQETEAALLDMDHLSVLLYHYYLFHDRKSLSKIKEYVLGWSSAYIPTGNPINENKLEPVWISFAATRSNFTAQEKAQVTRWLSLLAQKLQANTRVPMNNWQTKRIKILGTIGLVLQDEALIGQALQDAQTYVNQALYSDGTSADLRERDALSYHISGLVPLLVLDIHLAQLGNKKAEASLYTYQSPSGASVQKSVTYTAPFATGQLQKQEWVHSKADIDKRRAQAGIGHYQPGINFKPQTASELFEIAAFYQDENQQVARQIPGATSGLTRALIANLHLTPPHSAQKARK
jgi:hypothetical protein